MRFSQSVEGSDNRALNTNPAGDTALFTSNLMLDAISHFQTWTFDFNGDINYQNLTGPGAVQNTAPTNNILGLRIEKRVSDVTSVDIHGSWQRQDATSAQLNDTGIVIATGDINTYVLDGGITRELSPVDQFRWWTRGTIVDFSANSNESFSDLLTTTTWARHLTARAVLTNTLQLEGVEHDDPANSQVWIARASMGLETPFSNYLTFKGTLGVSAHNSSAANTANQIAFPGAVTSDTGPGVDGLGDLKLIYMALPTTQLTLSASHWTGPNVLGQVERRTIVGGGIQHTINQISSVSVWGEYAGQIPILGLFDDANANYVRASVQYNYRFTPDWIAQAAYRYAYRMDNAGAANTFVDAGSASSNTVFLSVVYEKTLLP